MAAELFIVGTQGLAKEMAQLARRIDPDACRWPSIHYVSNDPADLGEERPFGRVDMLDAQLLDLTEPADVVIGIGHPQWRRKVVHALRRNPRLGFPSLVHPGVELDTRFVRLGQGNLVTQGVVMTCDIEIGDFNLFNWNVTIGHDCRIGSYNVINPGSSISGKVWLGDACLIGTGARVLEGRKVANDVVLGAGAVLTRSIEQPGDTHVGVPARARSR